MDYGTGTQIEPIIYGLIGLNQRFVTENRGIIYLDFGKPSIFGRIDGFYYIENSHFATQKGVLENGNY